jgi:hypothetical protein
MKPVDVHSESVAPNAVARASVPVPRRERMRGLDQSCRAACCGTRLEHFKYPLFPALALLLVVTTLLPSLRVGLHFRFSSRNDGRVCVHPDH